MPEFADDDLESWLETALVLSQEAASILMEGWRNAPRVEKKGAIDLVTEFDLHSQRVIERGLAERLPEHAIVGEEGDAKADATGLAWFVDPLDGTTNFAHGHAYFSISIGLAFNAKPIVGVVRAPALNTLWKGIVGKGAERIGPEGARPCEPSSTNSLGEAVVTTGFPYDRATSAEDNTAEAAHFAKRVRGLRRCGSAAIDFCSVADGTYDGYWEQKLSPWDMCAGAAIAMAAGCRVTGYDDSEFDVHSQRILVSNGGLHEALKNGLSETRKIRGLL